MPRKQRVTLFFEKTNDTVNDVSFDIPLPDEGGEPVQTDNKTLKGSGVVGDPLSVAVSTEEGNTLGVNPDGLVVLQKQFKRAVASGNFSFGYPDQPTASSACGIMGGGVYWKTPINITAIPKNTIDVSMDVVMKELPCDVDGNIVPHRIFIETPSLKNGERVALVWLICDTAPTHIIDWSKDDRPIKLLQRNDYTITTGLPSYPITPEGEYAVEPGYIVRAFYMA